MAPKTIITPGPSTPAKGQIAKQQAKSKGRPLQSRHRKERRHRKAKPVASKQPMQKLHLRIRLRKHGPGQIDSEDYEKMEFRPGQRFWLKGDFLVIFTLWGFETLNKICEALKHNLLEVKTVSRSEQESGYLGLSVLHSLVLMLFTSFAVVYVAISAQNWNLKYWIVVVGLYLYSATALFGLAIVKTKDQVFVTCLNWLQLGWHVTNPLRFFLIFYQTWPIDVWYTRVVSSVNLFFIGLASYLSTIYIRQSEDIQESNYVVVWVLLIIAMLSWMVGIHFVKYYVLEDPLDVQLVGQIYSFTPAFGRFKHRNQITMTFAALLVPSFIFTQMAQLVRIALLPYKMSLFYIYRIDLVIGLFFTAVAIVVVHILAFIRHEMKDLIIIGGAHMANILSISLLLASAVVINDQVNGKRWVHSTENVNEAWASAGLYYPFEFEHQLIIQSLDAVKLNYRYLQFGTLQLWLQTDSPKRLRINGSLSGRHIFEASFDFIPNRSTFYYLPKRDEPLVKLEDVEKLPFNPNRLTIFLYNYLDACSTPENTFLIDSRCKDVALSLIARGENGQIIMYKQLEVPKASHKPVIMMTTEVRPIFQVKTEKIIVTELPLTSIGKNNNLIILFSTYKNKLKIRVTVLKASLDTFHDKSFDSSFEIRPSQFSKDVGKSILRTVKPGKSSIKTTATLDEMSNLSKRVNLVFKRDLDDATVDPSYNSTPLAKEDEVTGELEDTSSEISKVTLTTVVEVTSPEELLTKGTGTQDTTELTSTPHVSTSTDIDTNHTLESNDNATNHTLESNDNATTALDSVTKEPTGNYSSEQPANETTRQYYVPTVTPNGLPTTETSDNFTLPQISEAVTISKSDEKLTTSELSAKLTTTKPSSFDTGTESLLTSMTVEPLGNATESFDTVEITEKITKAQTSMAEPSAKTISEQFEPSSVTKDELSSLSVETTLPPIFDETTLTSALPPSSSGTDEDDLTTLEPPESIPSPPGLLAFAAILAASAFGAAQAGYIHFMWIKAPYDNRALLLALFFTWNYMSDWAAYTVNISFTPIASMLIFALGVISIAVHIVYTVMYITELPELETPTNNQMLF